MPPLMLSKSRYLNGLQCPRLLWIATNEPERIPEPDAATQHIFDQGHLVGELAKKLFPGGIDVSAEDFMGNIAMTKELLQQRKPLFEAGVLSGQIYSRADILNPVNEHEWDLIEVKSSTSVKEINLHDVSFQKLCLEDAGLKIGKCFLAYINNQYVRNGEINPTELFLIQDISDEVLAASEGIRERATQMLDIISSPDCPELAIGPHCSNPYECALTECWEGLPEHSVFTLYYGGKKSHELYSNGILDISQIPNSYKLNDKQRIQQASIVSGEPHFNQEAISEFLSSLKYPFYYLDFETFNTAIPLFDGVRPYQNIPFQFSLHVVQDEQLEPLHYSYLANGKGDPRLGLLAALREMLSNSGSIIAYNKGFEEGCLRDMASAFPEYNEWIERICSRLVDLLGPFRSFFYYHPLQKGSASLKAVMPAITGRGYDDLNISDGQLASLSFLAARYGNMPEADKVKVMTDLEKYCGRDTEGMIWIVEKLRELSI